MRRVLLHAEVHDVRIDACGIGRPPRPRELQRVPAGAAQVGDATCGVADAGLCRDRRAQRVLAVVVEAGRDFPIEHATAVALDRQPLHRVRQVILCWRKGKTGRIQAVAASGDVDATGEHRVAGTIAQPAVDAAAGAVVPGPECVGGAHRRRKVVGQLELGLLLRGVINRAAAQQPPRLVGRIQARHRTRHRHTRRARRTGAFQPVGKHQRLPPAARAIGTNPPRPIAVAPTQCQIELTGRRRRMGAVQVGISSSSSELQMRLERGRHARHVIDHRAHRVARIGSGERPVQHVDPLDFFRCHHAPARRKRRTVAQRIRQQDAIDIDQRARAVARA